MLTSFLLCLDVDHLELKVRLVADLLDGYPIHPIGQNMHFPAFKDWNTVITE